MKRFYVTMNWDDYPEGGSYGTVVEANNHNEAERMCKQEMAESRAESTRWNDNDAAYYLETYGDEWVTVDCYDLDEHIAMHVHPFMLDATRQAVLDAVLNKPPIRLQRAQALTKLLDVQSQLAKFQPQAATPLNPVWAALAEQRAYLTNMLTG